MSAKPRLLLVASPVSTLAFNRAMKLPNLALTSIAANVDKSLAQVRVLDLILREHDYFEYLHKVLLKLKPDIIGFSSMIFQFPNTLELIALTKRVLPDATILCGGYYPTIDYESIMEKDTEHQIDFILRNEAESSMNDFLYQYSNGKAWDKVPGLSFRDGDEIIHNPQGVNLDLEKVKLPDRDSRLIKNGFHVIGDKGEVIETTRGCVFDCKFCSITKMYGKSFRKYKIDRVIEDLHDVKSRGTKGVVLSDDNVSVDDKRYIKLCNAIIDEKLNDMNYTVQISLDSLIRSPHLPEIMARAGVKNVMIGIENVGTDNLNYMMKSKQFEGTDAYKAVRDMKKQGITVSGSLIVGFPDDDEKSIYANLDYVNALDLDFPLFFILTPLPGTVLRDEMEEMGLITDPDTLENYDFYHPVIKTKHLPPERLWEIREDMAFKFLAKPKRLFTFFKAYPRFFVKLLIDQTINQPQEVIGYFSGPFKKRKY